MPIAKVFIYFVALKIGAEFLFKESLSLVAAAVCAIVMVGVEAYIGDILISSGIGRHIVRARFSGGRMLDGIKDTIAGLSVCVTLNALVSVLVVFAFSKALWKRDFTQWNGLRVDGIASWIALVALISLMNHLVLVWAVTHKARSL